MADKIKWEKADYKRLREAVKHYNSVIDSIEKTSVTPEKISYQEIKQGIFTREGLEQKIRSLERINEDNASKVHNVNGKFIISKYEWHEAQLAEKRYKTFLKKEKRAREAIQDTRSQENTMGDRAIKTLEKNIEKSRMQELRNTEDRTIFNEKLQTLMNRGSYDVRYLKTEQWKQNYLEIMKEKYSDFENYKLFEKKVKNMTPDEFYAYMQKDELAEDLSYMSDSYFDETEFNAYLESIDIQLSGDTEII